MHMPYIFLPLLSYLRIRHFILCLFYSNAFYVHTYFLQSNFRSRAELVVQTLEVLLFPVLCISKAIADLSNDCKSSLLVIALI